MNFTTQITFITLIGNAMAMPIRETILGGCISTQYGCCHDNSTTCLDFHCSNCDDMYNQTELGGCVGTEFGCCHDNATPCTDLDCMNCYASTVIVGGCNGTKFGCCADDFTPCLTENCGNCPIGM